MTTRRTSADPAESWLVALVVVAVLAGAAAVTLAWRLATGGVW